LIYNKVTFLKSEDRKKIAKKLKNNRKNKSLGKMVKKSNSHSFFISERISKLPIIKRFVIFGLLPILLTTIITQSYFINRVQDLEWKAKEIEMKEIIAHYEDSITEIMIRTSRISQNLAVNPNIIAAHESEFLDWFPNILKNNPEIYNIYVAYISMGNLTLTYRNGSSIITQYYPKSTYQNANQRWYDLPLEIGSFVVEEAHFDEDFMKIWMISLLCPIFNDSGSIIGMVGTDIALSSISSLISPLSENNSRNAFLVENFNQTSRIIATDNGKYIGCNLIDFLNETGHQKSINYFTADSNFNDYDEKNSIYLLSDSMEYVFSQKIENDYVDWTLCIIVPSSEIYQNFQRISTITLGIGLLSLLLLTIFFLNSANSLTRSINSFITQTNAVRKGRYNPIEHAGGGAELRELRKNFNLMITQIQNQLQEFRVLADLSPFAIVSITFPDILVYANQAFRDLMGFTKDELKTLDDWFNFCFINEMERSEIKGILDQIVSNFEEIHKKSKLIHVRTKSGQILQLSIHLVKVNEKNAFFIFEDETTKKKEEAERLRAQKLESLSIIAGGIAHDFNNILMGLLGNINLLQMEENLPPYVNETLSLLEKSVTRARGITNQLLTFSKGGEPIRKRTNLEHLIKDSVDFTMHGSKCVATIDINSPLPDVDIDESQITQVLNNFLINAQQAMPEGGLITIRAITEHLDNNSKIPLPAGDYVKCEIQDEGIGIDPQYQNKIFTPYFTLKPKGNGLGLATSYSIIKKHHGYIGFSSKLGFGSTFFFYLPISTQSDTSISESESEEPFPSIKILILEDEKDIRITLSKILNKWGCEVSYASEGSEALVIFKEALKKGHPFEVAILDLTIPGGLGGKEIVLEMKSLYPEIVTIMASGYSNEEIMGNYQQFGFDNVLKKPFSMNKLRKTILNTLKKKEKYPQKAN